MYYNELSIDIILFETDDIVTTSGGIDYDEVDGSDELGWGI